MWYSGIKDFDRANWVMLKAELDLITNRRFTPFFCNQVVCCENLLEDFKPLISRNLTLLKRSNDELFEGTIISRQGVSASVGGASYNLQGIDNALRDKIGTFDSPTVLPHLIMLMHKYGLTYPAPRNSGVINWTCGGCGSCECKKTGKCGCGGDSC